MNTQKRCPVCKTQLAVMDNHSPTCKWTFTRHSVDINDQVLIENLITLHSALEKHKKLWSEQQLGRSVDDQTALPIDYKNKKDSEIIQADPVQEVIFYWSRKLGEGIVNDYAEAVNWCRKAVEQGDTLAQYDLGVAYEEN
jgi:hypothetical protein